LRILPFLTLPKVLDEGNLIAKYLTDLAATHGAGYDNLDQEHPMNLAMLYLNMWFMNERLS
jgi:hypothetical protein